MKTRELIIGLVVAVLIVGGAFIIKSSPQKKGAAGTAPVQKSAQAPGKTAVAKKAFSKGMGGLTVQVVNVKKKPVSLRAKVFRSLNPKSSAYVNSFVLNTMRELAPGVYDVELDTMPQMIYKNVKVSAGKETVENLDCVTGVLSVKVMDANNKTASYPIRVYHPGTGVMIVAATANRPLEILAGAYDIEIGTLPKVVEASVIIEPGKEKVLNLGVMTGALVVKAIGENKVENRYARESVKIKKADTNELIINTRINKSIELRPGTYNVEIGTMPPQTNKDVKINAGEETVVEVVVKVPPQEKLAPNAALTAKTPRPAKGRQD